MYREEKWVRGQLFWRSTPDGDWRMATPDQIIAKLRETLSDIRPHVAAWTALLEKHVASLPPDLAPGGYDGDGGQSDRSYAEHELRAMKRDLGALLAATL